jgi:hypothetical protein
LSGHPAFELNVSDVKPNVAIALSHNSGMLMAYLPKEKLLVEADVFTPPAPNAPSPAAPNPATVNLYEHIERLHLDVVKIVPIHGQIVPLAELHKAIGKKS